ncbi:MAG: hypothetical protein KME26_13960 [Oscillatoria princeps RMCB-10]|nr:hypothetical protein [Oscillatoria princeps RMCB-10]
MKFSSTDKEPAHLGQRWGASLGDFTGYTGTIYTTRCGLKLCSPLAPPPLQIPSTVTKTLDGLAWIAWEWQNS